MTQELPDGLLVGRQYLVDSLEQKLNGKLDVDAHEFRKLVEVIHFLSLLPLVELFLPLRVTAGLASSLLDVLKCSGKVAVEHQVLVDLRPYNILDKLLDLDLGLITLKGIALEGKASPHQVDPRHHLVHHFALAFYVGVKCEQAVVEQRLNVHSHHLLLLCIYEGSQAEVHLEFVYDAQELSEQVGLGKD